MKTVSENILTTLNEEKEVRWEDTEEYKEYMRLEDDRKSNKYFYLIEDFLNELQEIEEKLISLRTDIRVSGKEHADEYTYGYSLKDVYQDLSTAISKVRSARMYLYDAANCKN